MDYAPDAPLGISLNRYYKAAVTLGHDGIRKVLLHLGVFEHLIKALTYAPPLLCYLLTYACQLLRGRVGDLVLAEYGISYPVLQPLLG